MRKFNYLLIAALALTLTGCDFIGDIFGAGVYTGVFIVIFVIVLIIVIIYRIFKRK